MSNHLSEEQFAKCFVQGATAAEHQHLIQCERCAAALEAFGETVSSLRKALRNRADLQVASQNTGVTPVLFERAAATKPKLRHVLAAAGTMVVLGLVPFLTMERPQGVITEASEANPDALMNAINLHLSRTMPSPMEPIMSLIPDDALGATLGGVR